MEQAEFIIDIKDMSKSCLGDMALDNISLRVRHGEFVAVVGATAAEKSALMNIIGCLESPDSGSYTLSGNNVSEMTDMQKSYLRGQKIGFILGDNNLLPTLTLEENLALPLVYAGIPRRERGKYIEKVLEEMNLTEMRNRLPQALSASERSRAAVARALVNAPQLIIAYEPTASLGAEGMGEIIRCLDNLYTSGKTLILITEDQDLALCAERIVRISEGRIVYDNASVWGGDA